MRGSDGTLCGDPLPGVIEITADLGLELIHRIKFYFVPKPVPELNVNALAIKCASKVKQVHFQGGLPAVHRRAQTNVGHAVENRPTLKPGADHVMVTGLKQPLTAGTTFPLTLAFEKSGQKLVEVSVRPLSGAGGME